MKLCIISDTHFGDDACTLVRSDLSPGEKYPALLKTAGQDNDYLILAGDVFDFSIASYEKAYRFGQIFFRQIQKDRVAKEIIYLPGNHDGDVWHIVQHQRNVINRLQKGLLPNPYDHSVPGIIDDRRGSAAKGLILDKTKAQTRKGRPRYGGLFLDGITAPTPTVFNIAYPTLYIVTDEASVMVTHGHYLEKYWCLSCEVLSKIAYDDLKTGDLDVEGIVELNYPLNQLACTGIGQAGILTAFIRQIQQDVKNNDLRRVRRYLDRLERYIDDLEDFGFIKELIVDLVLKNAKEQAIKAISTVETARYSDEFIYKKKVRNRFKRFYAASLLELGGINARTQINIPAPGRVIFGHTHQPIPWDDPKAPKIDAASADAPKHLTLHNTGGWLMEGEKFCGAEVFLYETGKGFRSASIT